MTAAPDVPGALNPAAPASPEPLPPRGGTEARAWPLLKRLWRGWLGRHWPRLSVNLFLIAIVAASTSLYPLIIKWALEGFETRAEQVIAGAPLLVIGAVVLKSAALYAHRLLTNSVLAEVDADLQRDMYAALVRADLARLDREAPAATASRFTTDILFVHRAAEKLITALVRDGLTLIGLLGALHGDFSAMSPEDLVELEELGLGAQSDTFNSLAQLGTDA